MAAQKNVRANLIERENRYYVIINFYSSDGKRKQKSISTGLTVSGHNKRKAEARCKELLIEWEKRLALNNSEMLFSDYLKEWLEHHHSRIADSTYQEYKKNIHKIICPYFSQMGITLFDLKPQHIQGFYDSRMKENGVGAKTIRRYHANIHKSLAYAVKMGRIASNPADLVELPKAQEHQADFYTVDELKMVIEKAKGTQIEPVIMLAAWFGLRRGEIIGLRWSSINFDTKTLSITGVVKDKGPSGVKNKDMYYSPTAKTKSSLRSFPLNDEMVAYLKNLKSQQDKRRSIEGYNHTWDDFVCVRDDGDLIPLEYVSRAFPKLCEDCGLRKLKLHELRHTNITLLLSAGASMKDVQSWAGHSNFSVTANTYAHVSAKSKSRLTESISSLLK